MTEGTGSDTFILKPVIFHRAVREAIREFPVPVKKELGKAILKLQMGGRLIYPLSKSMFEVGAGVEEIRIRDRSGSYRVFCLARLTQAILVFHAFQKKTAQTPRREIETGKRRLREMIYA